VRGTRLRVEGEERIRIRTCERRRNCSYIWTHIFLLPLKFLLAFCYLVYSFQFPFHELELG
jgi:hypothetical protein